MTPKMPFDRPAPVKQDEPVVTPECCLTCALVGDAACPFNVTPLTMGRALLCKDDKKYRKR